MRITGGEWRSRRLKGAGKVSHVRPTPDSMRERAFAVIGDRVRGSRFLDLWAGTGAVGLEALSRGARSVVFVERHRAAAHLIEENSAAFDLSPDRAELIVRPAGAAIKQLIQRGDGFDLVWADPPFEDWQQGLEAITRLHEEGLLHDEGLACLECPARADLAALLPPRLRIERDLVGGASRVVMIEGVSADPSVDVLPRVLAEEKR